MFSALSDYHVHTPLCLHAKGWPVEFAARAVELGLGELGISDHNPMPEYFDNWRMLREDLPRYFEEVEKARAAFPQLRIRLGLECDYLAGREAWIEELAGMAQWDFFIGSVHYVSDSWAVDSPYKLSEWKNRDVMEVWSIYFERLTMAAESGLFEIIGHADLPKKFGHRPTGDCTPMFEKFLNAAKAHRCAIDVNTAGLRKDCKEIYPSRELLTLAFRHGIPITLGSDAHAPEEVGMNFKEAIELVRRAGYTSCLTFKQKRAQQIKL